MVPSWMEIGSTDKTEDSKDTTEDNESETTWWIHSVGSKTRQSHKSSIYIGELSNKIIRQFCFINYSGVVGANILFYIYYLLLYRILYYMIYLYVFVKPS